MVDWRAFFMCHWSVLTSLGEQALLVSNNTSLVNSEAWAYMKKTWRLWQGAGRAGGVHGFECFLTALMLGGPGGSTGPEECTDEQKSKLWSPKLKQAAERRAGFGSWLGCHELSRGICSSCQPFFSNATGQALVLDESNHRATEFWAGIS